MISTPISQKRFRESRLRIERPPSGRAPALRPQPPPPPAAPAELAGQHPGYFYWKKSPTVFELYTLLEADDDGSFSTATCAGADEVTYNHGFNSALRQDVARFTL